MAFHHYWGGVGPHRFTDGRRRAAMAARHVPEGARVLDLGCGAQVLREELAPGCRYVPADVEPRSADTLVVDLDAGFPPGDYDVIVMLGVLEYLTNPDIVLQRCRERAARLIASYTTKRVVTGRMRANGTRVGRRNYLSSRGFAELLAAAGWTIECRETVGSPLRIDGRHELAVCC